ncbi:hypothetical protein [Candidatus Pelagibacter sp.]|uniref:hypothetical protein n=1 Tax=Candidatus Pelagibacter sp. TaxID=2024849 RepID=UPI003F82BB17
MNIELRDPNIIMKLSRLGSFHQSRLSFLRSFLSEFKDWQYNRDLFDLDQEGYGIAVYSFKKKDRVYSLICYANKINDDERSDRVIATKWDAAFTLHDGVPLKEDIDRLRNEVPKQEVGRLSYKELTLSRANKSVRVFDHVVKSLSNGDQPDLELLEKVGYLYRTTAVYGSGKFGLADRFRIKNREEINGPFRLEMMLVYLVRQFTFDQVNHVAKNKNPNSAVKLDPKICRNLGIGNSTGLGMAPFIVNHPTLLNNWILSREIALKKIREIKIVKTQDRDLFKDCVKSSLKNITSWNTESEYQLKKIKLLLKDIKKFISFLENEFDFQKDYPFNEIYLWLEKETCEECIEYVVSIMMEPFGDIIQPLVGQMSSEEEKYFNIPTERNVGDLKKILENKYSDILKINFNIEESNQKFWFISKNKEEPRLANRFEENGADLEQPLAIARDIKKLYERLLPLKDNLKINQFLIDNSDLRHVVRRAFIIEKFPYSEIQDNTIGENLVPIDMLRLKLSFFGALKFDPRSDKWLRICMFQGAPLPNELKDYDEQWVYKAHS